METLFKGDCLAIMPTLPEQSIDLIACDLPYGVTQCKWDSIIPFDKLWKEYKRILKPKGAIVLTASQPFTSALVMSNPKWFRYALVWKKSRKTGFLNAKRMPLRQHEDILVFGQSITTYNPQGCIPCNMMSTRGGMGKCYGDANSRYLQTNTNYPTSIVDIKSTNNSKHPTGKPVELMEWLIKTYSNENDTVLDNAMGAATTGIACINTNRHFIGIEQDQTYFDIASNRIKEARGSQNC
jgi:site-specific DNA-methyltransferase (adenine-specific)